MTRRSDEGGERRNKMSDEVYLEKLLRRLDEIQDDGYRVACQAGKFNNALWSDVSDRNTSADVTWMVVQLRAMSAELRRLRARVAELESDGGWE